MSRDASCPSQLTVAMRMVTPPGASNDGEARGTWNLANLVSAIENHQIEQVSHWK